MKRARYNGNNAERGSALILVMVMLMTLTVLGVGVIISATTNMAMSRNYEISIQAQNMAEIGAKVVYCEFINSNFIKTTHTEDMADVATGNDLLTTDLSNYTVDEDGNFMWEWDDSKNYDPLLDTDKPHGFKFSVYYTSDKVFVIESEGWYGTIHQRTRARGRIESMFEFSYLSAGDLGEFVEGSEHEVRGKVHANGNIYICPNDSSLWINPLYFTSSGDFIRSRDAWNRPDMNNYNVCQITRNQQDSGNWVEMEPGNPRGTEGVAFDSYHPDWASSTEGAQDKWGGIVHDRVNRKSFLPIRNLETDGYYNQLAQAGGLVIDNTSHNELWCTRITDFYNTNEQRNQILWEIDIENLIIQNDWPGNGLIYCKVPVRLINAQTFAGDLMLVSCRNIYTSGSFNIRGDIETFNNISGSLNIDPTTNAEYYFDMQTPSGEIDIDELQFQGSEWTYSGDASEIKIKVKSGETLTADGANFDLDTSIRYTISGTLNVSLYNTNSGQDWNHSKDHWWIDITGNDITIDPKLSEVYIIKNAAIMTSQRIYHLKGAISGLEGGDTLGLQDGHLDVDTSSFISPINDGTSDGHVHEYDNKYDVLGVDFFNVLDDKLHSITTDIPSGSTKFKIIVANADITPGGRIVINQDYDDEDPGSYELANVYDDIALSALPVYSFDGVAGTTQLVKLGMYFDIDAITAGNVINTSTHGVRNNVPGLYGEWRNGALTIHVVLVNADDSDGFTTDTSLSSGGVQGVATSGLLYESTIFWHWKGPAYHEAGWSTYTDPGEEIGDEFGADVRINAALVDGAPGVDEYNWVDMDGDHRYDYNNSLIYDDWNAKDLAGFNNPYNSSNPSANTENFIDDWTGKTLLIYGSIVHLGSNFNSMADNLDNSGISDDQIAWIREKGYSPGRYLKVYNPDLGTSAGQPPFTPLVGQITSWAPF